MEGRLRELLERGKKDAGQIVFLTGAGISAESGIPTFRGAEGYWTVGSTNYHPQEMATHEAFERMPEEVWRWYLYRRSVCRKAEPNAAHHALVELERALGDRFLLVTQNVDGLHLRAGSSIERCYQIHGNIDYLRCESESPQIPKPVPVEIGDDWTKDSVFDDRARKLLACCDGGELSRPHVLWFDESYDEPLFRFESTLKAALSCSLLVVVGTSGQTSLPFQMVSVMARRSAPLVVVNQDESPFSEAAERSKNGLFVRGSAGEHVPEIARYLAAP
jgi:NAD-dependent deacetylase